MMGKHLNSVIVKDVPVDGFWSITVYNKDGYLEKNDLGVCSYNKETTLKAIRNCIERITDSLRALKRKRDQP